MRRPGVPSVRIDMPAASECRALLAWGITPRMKGVVVLDLDRDLEETPTLIRRYFGCHRRDGHERHCRPANIHRPE